MHHVRGLVRRSSSAVLRRLEDCVVPHDVTTCFVNATIVDSAGCSTSLQLLHSAALLQVLNELTPAEALRRIREVREIPSTVRSLCSPLFDHTAADTFQEPKATRAVSEKLEPLFVKRTTALTVAEIACRQSRFLSKVVGRLMASDMKLVEGLTERLVERTKRPTNVNCGLFTPEEVSLYRGTVEELSRLNPAAAIALAMNSKLPSTGSGASAALAQLVRLEKTAAVLSFLEGFAAKDEVAPAFETCATQIAIRLRNKLWELEGKGNVSSAGDTAAGEPTSKALRDSLALACRFNVDPSVVFPTDAAAIQQWSSQFLQGDMLPRERAEVIAGVVCRKNLLPRRIALGCLSSWCLNDMEHRWFISMFSGDSKDNGAAEGGEARLPGVDESVVRCAATSCALKDPTRSLVYNRLLHQYAVLLGDGEIEPTHPSFPHFLEECGECHLSTERPKEFSFILKVSASTVMEELLQLAPQCSYWRTLLERKRECVSAAVAPQGCVCVTVRLPEGHECVEAAKAMVKAAGKVGKHSDCTLPSLPVIYEDSDLVVINKPPHIATSRHALSCTQLNDGSVVDVVSLQLASSEYGNALCHVFRQGQVHRLDSETSGCLLMAKSDVAAASLRHQMGTSAGYSQSNKVYIALCAVLEQDLKRIPLRGVLRDPADAKVNTRYRVMRFFERSRVVLVECRIQQGKKHQVRRHLAAAGLPILQDVVHGGAACCTSIIQRVALHASCLTVVHPRTAEVISCQAPLPSDMREAIRLLS
uniref:Pseudouridine synthase RsuA/RluA-like domain-containing protein n=1 Tax=Trypanosoma vivax (strain Y486) TaxID=1055687 RepID=G0TSN3_TRYVY|nr:conserved hypothetical protein [Trypanosoma vivax Y486]